MTISRLRVVYLVAVVAISAVPAAAQTPAAEKPEVFLQQSGNIRVFYETTGQHAVDATDANQNKIPDQVEDALTQIRAAQILFIEALGYPDPFQSDRYRNVSFLDVRFRHKDVLKSNGKAYDELQRFKRPGDPEGTTSLSVGLATSVKAASNPTPMHEFFHVIQNGATFFKNRWFTEGTARWSQRPFGNDGPGATRKLGEWPLEPEKSAILFEMAYDAAAYFWKPLVSRYDAEGAIGESALIERLKAMTYADGSKVLKDARLPGWRLVGEILRELGKSDDSAFRELGYERWSEENQRSAANNRFVLAAITRVVERKGSATK